MTNAEPVPVPSDATRVRRRPDRARYDAATVHAVLDAAPLSHVGLIADGRPVVIPMLHGRHDDHLYLHGSVASRLLRAGAAGIDLCVTATIVDGLVLARSAFHHSMNYRSVVVMGRAEQVTGTEKVAGLRAISEHLAPGRWDEVRPPTDGELRQTTVLRLPIEEASAKIRTGGPVDDEADLGLDVWAGILPALDGWSSTPVPADDLRDAIPVSASVRRLVAAASTRP